MFVLWIGTFLLGSSPELHRLLHSDANSPNHHCVVTQVREHSFLSGISIVAAPAPPAFTLSSIRGSEFQIVSSSDYRLSPSRAPPVAFSSATVAG